MHRFSLKHLQFSKHKRVALNTGHFLKKAKKRKKERKKKKKKDGNLEFNLANAKFRKIWREFNFVDNKKRKIWREFNSAV